MAVSRAGESVTSGQVEDVDLDDRALDPWVATRQANSSNGEDLKWGHSVAPFLKSFNRKPQACALGMDGSLSAVSANTRACGLRLNDLSARQGKLPHPTPLLFPHAV